MTAPPIPGLNHLLDPLPRAFRTLRPHQIPAIMDILDAYEQGEKVVVLDAPTGVGKTVIAECVRLLLDTKGSYVAHNKDLQSQFSRDFPYAPVLWGKANYKPTRARMFPGANCGDCNYKKDVQRCGLCVRRDLCPYQLAKGEAIVSPVPVLNSAYWLSETQSSRSWIRDRGLTIFDEADTLESVLMGQVSVSVSERAAREYGIEPPKRMTKEDSYVSWGKSTLESLSPHLSSLRAPDGSSVGDARRLHHLEALVSNVQGMVEGLVSARQRWVYTGGGGSDRRRGEQIEFRPVEVAEFGKERIWGQDRRFLLMSGTVISSSMLLEGLGWEGGHRLVRVDSQFPAKNRMVVVRPTVDMSKNGVEDGFARMAAAVDRILDEPAARGASCLVHTTSYGRSSGLAGLLGTTRPVFTYRASDGRSGALEQFKRTPGSVLIAPSMDRGVDLPDDLCRVQIIAKVPYPNLGDKQVAERLYRTKNGRLWYAVQVARSVMQMVGRGVRHKDDRCVVYVLDSSFGRWYSTWQTLLPAWFRQAVRFEGKG